MSQKIAASDDFPRRGIRNGRHHAIVGRKESSLKTTTGKFLHVGVDAIFELVRVFKTFALEEARRFFTSDPARAHRDDYLRLQMRKFGQFGREVLNFRETKATSQTCRRILPIARSLVYVGIFDEPMSYCDPETRERFYSSLRQLMHKTIIVIADDPLYLHHFDRAIVMDKGSVLKDLRHRKAIDEHRGVLAESLSGDLFNTD